MGHLQKSRRRGPSFEHREVEKAPIQFDFCRYGVGVFVSLGCLLPPTADGHGTVAEHVESAIVLERSCRADCNSATSNVVSPTLSTIFSDRQRIFNDTRALGRVSGRI